MSLSVSEIALPTFTGGLKTLVTVVDKAASYAEEKGIDARTLLDARLHPDMFPFIRQVQTAADLARRGLDRISGIEPSSVEDREASFEELRSRLLDTLAYVGKADRALLDASEDRKFQVPMGKDGQHEFDGRSYLMGFSLPNFLFHVTTAYAILRNKGVELGKRDFLGPFVEANTSPAFRRAPGFAGEAPEV